MPTTYLLQDLSAIPSKEVLDKELPVQKPNWSEPSDARQVNESYWVWVLFSVVGEPNLFWSVGPTFSDVISISTVEAVISQKAKSK